MGPSAEPARRGGGRRATTLLIGAVAALALAFAATALGALSPNPADHPRLLDKPLERFRYDYATGCRQGARKGTRALRAWLEGNVRGSSWGINRCERRAARRLIRTLLATDARGRPHALARRMGIQGWIFNCRQWFGSSNGLGPYSYCFRPNGKRRRNLNRTQAHMDHVHIELNWRGARMRTSFWRSPPAVRR